MIRFRLRWQLLLVVVTALVARAVVAIVTLYQVDDAMITFRYAENLAAGLGFVYNAGEHVLGTTSPLWTIYLASVNVFGLSVPVTAHVTSIILAGFSAALVYQLARRLNAGPLALVAGVITAIHPRLVTTDICGLEMAFFSALLIASIYLLISGRHSASLVLASVAVLARPEGALLLLIVAITAFLKGGRQPWSGLLMAAALVLPWICFSTWYFGSPLPNSMVAKAGLYGHDPIPLLQRLVQELSLTNAVGWLLCIGAILAVTFAGSQRQHLIALAAITLGIAVPVAAFSLRIFFWYAAPLLPLLITLAACGFSNLSNQISSRPDSPKVRVAVAAVLVLLFVFAVPLLVERSAGLRAEMQWYRVTHIAAAEYLVAHAGPDDSVLAEDIGHFGYHYRGPIIDRDGLVTPQAIPYNKAQRYFDFVDSVDAEWLMLAVMYHPSSALLEQPRFLEHYRPVESGVSVSNPSHRLYRRQRPASAP